MGGKIRERKTVRSFVRSFSINRKFQFQSFLLLHLLLISFLLQLFIILILQISPHISIIRVFGIERLYRQRKCKRVKTFRQRGFDEFVVFFLFDNTQNSKTIPNSLSLKTLVLEREKIDLLQWGLLRRI